MFWFGVHIWGDDLGARKSFFFFSEIKKKIMACAGSAWGDFGKRIFMGEIFSANFDEDGVLFFLFLKSFVHFLSLEGMGCLMLRRLRKGIFPLIISFAQQGSGMWYLT